MSQIFIIEFVIIIRKEKPDMEKTSEKNKK